MLEETKLFSDYIKHVNTLSTSAILILITFNDKISQNNNFNELIAIAFIAFVLSIFGGIAFKTILTSSTFGENTLKETPVTTSIVTKTSLIFFWCGFMIGILSLGTYGAINFFNTTPKSVPHNSKESHKECNIRYRRLEHELEKCDEMLKITEEKLDKLVIQNQL